MADITATIASQLAQAAQAIQRPAPPKPEAKAEAPAKDTPSVEIGSGLSAALSIDESNAPVDSGKAKEVALAAREQLAGQTLSIANQSPQKLQSLFH